MLAQEEPVLLGPFLAKVMRARRGDVVGLGLAPMRSTGRPPRSAAEAWERTRTLFKLFEPAHFARFLAARTAARLGLRRSLRAEALQLGVPVLEMADPNSEDFLAALRRLNPDVILNQSDWILRKPLLDLPRIGVINRHGSRLPDHRGRLGSFWQHYLHGDAGAFWVTVHFVDEGLDTGEIIVQRSFPIAPSASYGEVIQRLFDESPSVVMHALDRLQDPAFMPMANPADQGSSHGHPTLEDARNYRQMLAERRAAGQASTHEG